MSFDKLPNRNNLFNIKYDAAKKFSDDVIPMWVAEMDFKISDVILEDLNKQITSGVLGYTNKSIEIYEEIQRWVSKRYEITVDTEEIILSTGVVHSMNSIIRALTKEEDEILILSPVYPPFYNVVLDNNRKLVIHNINDSDFDIERLIELINVKNIKMILICNPHNPIGKCWRKQELQQLISICYKKNILVVSDEIHADIIYENRKHNSIFNIQESEEIGIVLMSPCKTFNIPGLKVSYALIKNQNLRNLFEKQIRIESVGSINIIGLVALLSAYRKGESWLTEVNKYLEENRNYLFDYIEKYIPNIKMNIPEATYLAWLDLSYYNLDNPKQYILENGKILLNSGIEFGKEYNNFVRLNFATSKEVLKESLNRMTKIF